jgi:hypothetical protein
VPLALHEGYTYEPDKSIFWKQSKGNEKSWLFVTTRHITQGYLDSIFSMMAVVGKVMKKIQNVGLLLLL